MIQRKQTLFLLLSAILMSLLPFFSMAAVTHPNTVLQLSSLGFTDPHGTLQQPTWGLFGLNILVVLLTFVTIFSFKNRTRQMRMTIFGLLLKLGVIALAGVYLYTNSNSLTMPWSAKIATAFPILAIIADILAHRGIAVDDRLIKYMDRLR